MKPNLRFVPRKLKQLFLYCLGHKAVSYVGFGRNRFWKKNPERYSKTLLLERGVSY